MTSFELLQKVGQRFSINILLNEHNVCRIIFDDDPVDIELTDKLIGFISEIAPVPAADKETFYALVLSENYIGQGTGKAVLSLDGSKNSIYLHQFLVMPMEYEDFENELEAFIVVLRSMKNKLRGFQPGLVSGSDNMPELSENMRALRV